jgi:hypothetical protein
MEEQLMSDEQTPFIVMPKEHLSAWLAALRSGEYKQAKGCMFDTSTDGYCCLGVLEHVVSGEVETNITDGEDKKLPSFEWLERNGIQFFRPTYVDNGKGWALTTNPLLLCDGTREWSASVLNDSGKPFTEIADFIEKVAKGV